MSIWERYHIRAWISLLLIMNLVTMRTLTVKDEIWQHEVMYRYEGFPLLQRRWSVASFALTVIKFMVASTGRSIEYNEVSELRVCYNTIICMMLGVPPGHSAKQIFVKANVRSLQEAARFSTFTLFSCVSDCDNWVLCCLNCLISSCVCDLLFLIVDFIYSCVLK